MPSRLLLFVAAWADSTCGAQREPVARAAQELGTSVIEIDVDAAPTLATRYQVLNVPATAVEGQPSFTLVGARTSEELVRELGPLVVDNEELSDPEEFWMYVGDATHALGSIYDFAASNQLRDARELDLEGSLQVETVLRVLRGLLLAGIEDKSVENTVEWATEVGEVYLASLRYH